MITITLSKRMVALIAVLMTLDIVDTAVSIITEIYK